jgi:hypothetical protein
MCRPLHIGKHLDAKAYAKEGCQRHRLWQEFAADIHCAWQLDDNEQFSTGRQKPVNEFPSFVQPVKDVMNLIEEQSLSMKYDPTWCARDYSHQRPKSSPVPYPRQR